MEGVNQESGTFSSVNVTTVEILCVKREESGEPTPWQSEMDRHLAPAGSESSLVQRVSAAWDIFAVLQPLTLWDRNFPELGLISQLAICSLKPP